MGSFYVVSDRQKSELRTAKHPLRLEPCLTESICQKSFPKSRKPPQQHPCHPLVGRRCPRRRDRNFFQWQTLQVNREAAHLKLRRSNSFHTIVGRERRAKNMMTTGNAIKIWPIEAGGTTFASLLIALSKPSRFARLCRPRGPDNRNAAWMAAGNAGPSISAIFLISMPFMPLGCFHQHSRMNSPKKLPGKEKAWR
jgi:hypothetical protein